MLLEEGERHGAMEGGLDINPSRKEITAENSAKSDNEKAKRGIEKSLKECSVLWWGGGFELCISW